MKAIYNLGLSLNNIALQDNLMYLVLIILDYVDKM